MTTSDKEQQALRALDQLDQVRRQIVDESTAQGETVKNLDLGDIIGEVCRQYTPVKPLIETALWLIERIPIYGRQIAAAVRLLMSLLDRVCTST